MQYAAELSMSTSGHNRDSGSKTAKFGFNFRPHSPFSPPHIKTKQRMATKVNRMQVRWIYVVHNFDAVLFTSSEM